MKVGITGASGLIGTALTKRLRTSGHQVVPIVRRAPSADEIEWQPADGRLDPSDLTPLDAVVNLAGAGIGDHRWNDEYKQTLVDSRVVGTTLLANALADANGPQILISGSAIGYYGDRGAELLDESSVPGTGFLADLCVSWESSTAPAAAAGVRVVHIRTGIVLSPDGGALKKMLPLFKLGLGGRFGSGEQWMSWISLDDEVRAIEHLLHHEVVGAVNLTAPKPCQNRDFAKVLASVLKRPASIPVPRFGPRLLLGAEMADALLFESQRISPAELLGSGFQFDHTELESALEAQMS